MKAGRWARIMSYLVIALVAVPVMLLLYLVISGDYQVLTVKSGSMEPTFKAGDAIVLRNYDGGDIEPGEIIAFQENGVTVTHRAVIVEDGVITTKGDALENVDSWEVKVSDTKGTYLFKLPFLGYVAKFFQGKTGALFLIFFAVFSLIGLVMAELLGTRKAAKGGDMGKEPEVEDTRERERDRKKHWA